MAIETFFHPTHYQIVDLIYKSKRSFIYKAIRLSDNETVILKTFAHPRPTLNEIANIKKEYHLLKKLDFNKIVRAYELIEDKDSFILVLEYIDGQTLKNHLNQQPLELNDFFKIALSLVDTLVYLQKYNILHKDINSNNILIEKSGMKLIDFNISIQSKNEVEQSTNIANLEGTLQYLSPEQTGRMGRTLDYRTDFYSLGVVLYEMATGELPFKNEDALELVHAHLAKKPLSPHKVNTHFPNQLARIILKLLEKDPDNRYSSILGLKFDLLECQKQWVEKNQIDHFPLGEHDIHDRLHISQKLFGREIEIQQLLTAFDHVNEGKSGFLLVSGNSGTGKSVFVHEIQKYISQKKGFFIEGKFDPLKRNVAYYAIIQAITDLLKQLLSESEDILETYRNQIKTALGENARVIIDVIPELKLLIGHQAPVPILPPVENKNRFFIAFQNLIKVLAKKEHPLVIFLDDLQWADNSSLALIQTLLSYEDTHYFLVIGTYRNEEVDMTHPLERTIDNITKLQIDFKKIDLLPLKIIDVKNLLMDTFKKQDSNEIAELTTIIYQKTNGNPFFIKEILSSLYRKNVIVFSYQEMHWVWDSNKIKEIDISSNVIDLMIKNIYSLPQNSQYVLKLASCIGYHFDLPILTSISHFSTDIILTLLDNLVEAGLIISIHHIEKSSYFEKQTYYCFIHDQIKQAAYSLISEEDKKKIHLEIGRYYLKNMDTDKNNTTNNLFNSVNHLNYSINLIEENEKIKIATLNLHAAIHAKKSMSYQIALSYLQAGLTLTARIQWEQENELLLQLHMEAAECYFLTGEHSLSEKLFDSLLQKVTQKELIATIYESKVSLRMSLVKHAEAFKIGIEGLKKLGISLPEKPNVFLLIKEVLSIKWKTKKYKNVANLVNLPKMEDPYHIALDKLFERISCAAMQVDPLWFGLITCKSVNHAIDYGYSFSSIAAFATYALILVCNIGLFKEGYEFANVARKHADLLGTQLAYSKCFWTILVNHWFHHAVTSMDYLNKYYQASLESGDLLVAGYNMCQYGEVLYRIAKPIPEVAKESDIAAASLAKLNEKGHHDFIILRKQCLQYLASDPSVTREMIVKLADSIEKTNNLFLIRFVKTLLSDFHYYLGEWDQAFELAEQSEALNAITIGQILNADSLLIYALTAIKKYPSAEKKEKKRLMNIIHASLKKLKKWSFYCPNNYLFKYLLLNAEYHRLQKKYEKAADLYELAENAALRNNFFQYAGIINECAAKFYLEIKKPKIAGTYLLDARYAYLRWGAFRKIQLLEKEYPTFFIPGKDDPLNAIISSSTTTETNAFKLDFLAILKSLQAISSIIVLEDLLKYLLQIVMESAGAQKGCLLIVRSNNLLVEAEGHLKSGQIQIFVHPKITVNEDFLPLKLINFTYRTKESVLLDNSTTSFQFSHDPYFDKNQTKSALCIPITKNNDVLAILYLENNLLTSAFTNNHLSVLNILTAQAAISLENAAIYAACNRFVPRQFLEQLHRKNLSDVQLGDQIKCTAITLFCDIYNFTTLAESLTAVETFNFINRFLSYVSPIISEYDGFIDKYIGDAIMALFHGSSDKAVECAIAMTKRMEDFNREWQKEGGTPIAISIGVNMGELTLGIIGDTKRLESSVIGDSVNVASRVQRLARTYGTTVLVTSAIREQLNQLDKFKLRFIDIVHVKGKTEPIEVWEVCNIDSKETWEGKQKTLDMYHKACSLYHQNKLSEAEKLFNECLKIVPHDAVVKNYLERCKIYRTEVITISKSISNYK